MVGKHDGVHNYTIGQRKGLNLTNQSKEPLYVTEIDVEKNQVKVGREVALLRNALLANQMNWVIDPKLVHDRDFLVKTRSGTQRAVAKVSIIADNQVVIRFAEKQKAPTPGQAVVIYDDEEVVGGGVIDRTYLWKSEAQEFSVGMR